VITIEVNGEPLKAKTGETVLAALRRAGIHVPTLCYLENMFPSGACRMCVVEIEGQRGLVPSCACTVREGMKVKTHSPRVMRARRTIVELLLANHPDDCLYCERNRTCELQRLAKELGVRERRFSGERSVATVDLSSPSIVRDPAKCILCGRCVRVCEEVQAVSAIDFIGRGSRTRVGTAFNDGLNVSSCINCGQCILACPTGALVERGSLQEVRRALADPAKHVVVQHAPAISVTIGEHFGVKTGIDVCGAVVAALRRAGFQAVFDTSFSADLTVMEEGSELVHRLNNNGPLPLLTSCSPGWIKFVEQFYPEFIPNLSTCKSPQQMLGALIKSHYASRHGIDPASIYSVSVMPCTAKKFEASRPEMLREGLADIDAVLTTREAAQLIAEFGIELAPLAPEEADLPFGSRSSAGKLFGASGGVMEAAIRTAHSLVTGTELNDPVVTAVRSLEGVREARVAMGGLELGVAVAHGIANARRLLEDLKQGRDDLHFIEVMTCPGGCVGGGGQLHNTDSARVRERIQALYKIDRKDNMRSAHENKAVQQLYREFLGEPLSDTSHRLLHTHYARRDVTR